MNESPIDRIFGPAGARRALVVAGACGNVGYGKVGQFARLLALHGVGVVALDVIDGVEGVPERLRADLGGRFAPEVVERILAGVRAVKGGPADVGLDAGVVFEAIPERLELKREFYAAARQRFPGALLFSATSGFTTAALFAGLPGADRCGILHPFFPHLTSKLFEMVTGGSSSDATLEDARALLGALGLQVVEARDVPAFAADRLFCVSMAEAVRLAGEDGWSPALADAACREILGAAPFHVHNLIPGSNHLTASCLTLLHDERPSSLYAPPPVLLEMAADRQARWPLDKGARPSPQQIEWARVRFLGAALAVASDLVRRRIAAPRDVNFLAEEALKWRLGPCALVKSLGAGRARQLLAEFLAETGVSEPSEVASPESLEPDAWGPLYVRTSGRGDVALVEMGRTTLNGVFIRELSDALAEVQADDQYHAAVLTHDPALAGEFGRGADPAEFLPVLGDVVKARELSGSWKRALEPLRGPKSVVAAIARRSLGGSNEIAMLCRYRVAAARSVIGQPEPLVGVVPGLGGTHTLLRAAPPTARSEVVRLLLTGDPVGAERARQLGIVDEVVEEDRLLERALEAAAQLASGAMAPPRREEGPVAVVVPRDVPLADAAGVRLSAQHRDLMIRTIEATCAAPFERAQELETELAAEAFAFEAARIGVKALLSGRRPDFQPVVPAAPITPLLSDLRD